MDSRSQSSRIFGHAVESLSRGWLGLADHGLYSVSAESNFRFLLETYMKHFVIIDSMLWCIEWQLLHRPEATALIDWSSCDGRFNVAFESGLFGLFSAPVDQQASSSTTLVLGMRGQSLEVYRKS